jgi:uncharacterized membrane protein YphA (DoxX/SURF4 family)
MLVPELLAARFIIGSIFLMASLGKLSSSTSFKDEVMEYQLLSKNQARMVAYILPFFEMALGALCIIGIELPIVSALLVLLLLIFTVAIVNNLMRGRRFSCHCFGSSGAMIGPVTIARNLILVALAFWILLHTPLTLSFNLLSALWQSDIQQFAHVDIAAPLLATVILSLGILFLLGEIDTIFYEDKVTLT